jgi:NAD(P)-dependent dehydrogenase (short-subunit alcohol dehydrogenase family)
MSEERRHEHRSDPAGPRDEARERMTEQPVAIVTGGAMGLGEAIVGRLAADGYAVVVADIEERLAQQVADNLTAAGRTVTAMTCDVTREGEVAAMVDATVELFGRIDVLVCSAAIETRSSVVDCDDDDWQNVLDTNVKGPFLCMKHAIPVMVRGGGGGSVILMSSVLGAIGSPKYAAYCASKGALNNLCKQVAIEHAPDQIRVNVVSPSATDTGLFVRVAAKTADPEGLMQMVAGNTPMRRLGTADDVCHLVAFLAGPGSQYLSGAIIPLDGGMAARRP